MSIRIQIVTSPGPISAAIRFETRSWANHAELIDTDRQITLGARTPDGVKVRLCSGDHYRKIEHFVLNDIDSPRLLKMAWDWLESKVGTPYNYRGIVGITTNLLIENPKAMDCSQSIHLCCWRGAHFPLLSTRPSNMPWRVTPRDLLLSRQLVYLPT